MSVQRAALKTATLVHGRVVCGCLPATRAELSSCTKDWLAGWQKLLSGPLQKTFAHFCSMKYSLPLGKYYLEPPLLSCLNLKAYYIHFSSLRLLPW